MCFRWAFLFILVAFQVCAEPTAELTMMDDLLLHTRQSVQQQEKIRTELIEYQKFNKAFIADPDNKENLFCTIKSADTLLNSIQEAHLSENFSSNFINELMLFSKIANKKK